MAHKRTFDIVVLSDPHLGTVGCHAIELAQYFNSIFFFQQFQVM